MLEHVVGEKSYGTRWANVAKMCHHHNAMIRIWVVEYLVKILIGVKLLQLHNQLLLSRQVQQQHQIKPMFNYQMEVVFG